MPGVEKILITTIDEYIRLLKQAVPSIPDEWVAYINAELIICKETISYTSPESMEMERAIYKNKIHNYICSYAEKTLDYLIEKEVSLTKFSSSSQSIIELIIDTPMSSYEKYKLIEKEVDSELFNSIVNSAKEKLPTWHHEYVIFSNKYK